MPELPEVETVRRTLEPLLSGRRIAAFELSWPRTLANPEPATFVAHVLGQEIIGVGRRAKLVQLFLADGSFVSVHLRMTGELRFQLPDEPNLEQRLPYLRARFVLDDRSRLEFFDTRKFGRIALVGNDERDAFDRQFGIEPLEEAFTTAALEQLLRSRRRQIKPLLLDQSVIAGLGNIYVDESLFRAGVHPLTASDVVPPDRVAPLHAAIRDILTTAIQHQGTTLRDYRTGTGESGENQSRLLVYGKKAGAPCIRCGSPLQRLVVGQRGTVFCPTCQPVVTPDQAPD